MKKVITRLIIHRRATLKDCSQLLWLDADSLGGIGYHVRI